MTLQVVDYIERQEEHHHRMTFQEELRAIRRKHGIVLDEQHAWDLVFNENQTTGPSGPED